MDDIIHNIREAMKITADILIINNVFFISLFFDNIIGHPGMYSLEYP